MMQLNRACRRLCTDADAYNPRNVVRVLHRVQELLGAKVEFPRVVMCGDQSSGKTSVIEALIGEDISCKDSKMATRRPLLLSLIRTPRGAMKARFADGETVYSFEEVKDRIMAENDIKNTGGLDIGHTPIELTIYSEDVFDTILVDLPGFVAIPSPDQADDLPDQIMALNNKYLNDDNSILAVVTPATSDPSTSLALKYARQADKRGVRSIGVVTKVDLVGKNKEALLGLLQNDTFPMGHGRVGIRCRIQSEQLEGVDFNTCIERELEWINDNPDVRDAGGVTLGIPAMRMKLSDLLVQKIVPEIPNIITQLDNLINETRHNGDFLDKLSRETNMATVSKELERLTNQLHPAADSRQDFESHLRTKIFDIVCGAFNEAGTGSFDFKHTKESHLVDRKELQSHRGASSTPSAVTNSCSAVLKAFGYTGQKVEGAYRLENISKFRELLVFGGEGHMDGVSQGSVNLLKNRAIEIGAITSYFHHALPDNPRRARTLWNQGLQKTIDRVMLGSEQVAAEKSWEGGGEEATEGVRVPNTGLAGEIFNGLMAEIVTFVENQDVDGGDSGKLAKLYFRFLLDKIATRINDESMEQELIGMIERERRPVADFLELQNEVAKQALFPVPFDSWWGDGNKEIMSVEMFNKQWTVAYMRLASKRVSDDVFRILAVRLMTPLVFECIQYSLTLFSQKGQLTREAKQQHSKLEELEDIRSVLLKTYEASCAQKYENITPPDTTV